MNSLILLKKLSLFANCSFNQIPFSYILGLYKEDQATTLTHTHTHPIIHLSHTLLFWNFVHFTVIYTFPYFSISLTKSLFLDNTITTHHYPSLSHSIILKLHSFCRHIHISYFSISFTKSLFLDNTITTHHYTPLSIPLLLSYFETSSFCYLWTHFHIFLHFSYKICFLRNQHNPWHNTKNHSSSNYKLMYLLYLTFIYFTNTFLTNYPYIPSTYFSNISYKHHISQNIYISHHPYTS